MNQIELDEIKARCDKATPGPWEWDVIDAHKCIYLESARWKVMDFTRYGMNGAAPRFLVDGVMERADSLLKSIPGKEHHEGFDNYIDHPDAQFIAHARQDIPVLLAEVEQLNSYVETYKDICDKHTAINRELLAEIKRLQETLAKMRFAYINKDADFPHDFEVEALRVANQLVPLPDPPKEG